MPTSKRLSVRAVVAALERRYGRPAPPAVTDPFEQIVNENACYLVDDARRSEVFAELKRRVGVTPESILAAPRRELLDAIRPGGMRPEMRADKLIDAANEALRAGAPLREIVQRPFDEACKVLKRFPGMGDPGAEKVALMAGAHAVFALESNGLRALVRLGFGRESKNYAQTYRSVQDAVADDAPHDVAWTQRAHQLLRRHGQETCKRTKPLCGTCPLADDCPSAE